MSLRSNFFQRLVGRGLLTSEGEEWKRARRLSQPAFHRERVGSYGQVMVGLLESFDREMAGWRDSRRTSGHDAAHPRDRGPVSIQRRRFDRRVDEVGATLKELVKPFAAQATLSWILNNRLPTPVHVRFHRLARKIDNVVYRIISERRESDHDKPDLFVDAGWPHANEDGQSG